jgi:5-methylcytosine-specific restriction enzyme A
VIANKEILEEPVPTVGSLKPGAVYRRSDLHNRFGGNLMKGIVPSSREGVVLLFHTEEKNKQFYEDGWGPDGFYSYSGEGRHGDMKWAGNNHAIRDHVRDGRDLLLFERTQRRRGLWQYYGIMECHGFEYRQAPDFKNQLRRAIIFKLLAENDARESVAQDIPLSNLRDRAYITLQPQENPTLQTILERRKRSQDVKVYVLSRAGRVIFPFQKSPVVQDRVCNIH